MILYHCSISNLICHTLQTSALICNYYTGYVSINLICHYKMKAYLGNIYIINHIQHTYRTCYTLYWLWKYCMQNFSTCVSFSFSFAQLILITYKNINDCTRILIWYQQGMGIETLINQLNIWWLKNNDQWCFGAPHDVNYVLHAITHPHFF